MHAHRTARRSKPPWPRERAGLGAAALSLILAGCAPADGQEGFVVPFELVRNQIVLEVRVAGRGPFNMLLDTAVVPSVFDLATAEGVGAFVDRDRSGEASGAGSDRVTIYETEIPDLSIAGHPFGTIAAVAADVSALGERLGRSLHGVLGYSFLSSRAVRIDYPSRTVHIFEGPAPSEGDAERFEIPMELDGTDVILEPVHVNGHPLRVTLDTGSSLVLEVYSHAAERAGLLDLRATADTGSVMGARGAAGIRTAAVDSLRIGPFAASDPSIVFPERDRDTDGNLGNGFLKDFVLTVDYVARRVILTR